MSRPIPAADYVEHFDPELPHHRAWLLAVLEQLVAHDPKALEEGGSLRRLWNERQTTAASASPSQSPSPPAVASGKGNPLSVPWFAQLDSATDQARRMCFSSSCAMLLAYLKPGVLIGSNGDDQYLARVRHLGVADGEPRTSGDTTDAAAQIRALASYGIKARFTNQTSFSTLGQQIAAGIPVPCGYLHRGPVSSPAGGGHWLIVVGITPSHVIVHDPLGEADLVNGTTLGGTARFCRYSRKNYRCAGLLLRPALDDGGTGERLGGAGGGVMSHDGCSRA
ncbi:MAG: C39 family peptidase [Cyanobacteriota bacterium]